MDKVRDTEIYQEDIKTILAQNCDWQFFKGKTFLITGATGLIGTVLVDMLRFLNQKFSLKLHLVLLSRSKRNSEYDFMQYIAHDVSKPFEFDEKIDFIIHAASNTHPLQYSEFPIETSTTNLFGTYNLLKLAERNPTCRFLLVSSVEIYGDDKTENENGFSEIDMGYLDCNMSRACYNESKRMSETMCAAFAAEKHIDYTVARLSRCYGPTLKNDDSKALSQFLRNGILGQDIVLKSEGKQFYSYIYSADAASALIFLLLNGKNGEAYNVSDEKSNATLLELASYIAELAGTKLTFDLPSKIEQKGFSKAQRAIINPKKIHELGWEPAFDIQEGLKRTLICMKETL